MEYLCKKGFYKPSIRLDWRPFIGRKIYIGDILQLGDISLYDKSQGGLQNITPYHKGRGLDGLNFVSWDKWTVPYLSKFKIYLDKKLSSSVSQKNNKLTIDN